MAPTETVGKLCVIRSKTRPPLSSQVLSSVLSTSSDCSYCHTTANELSVLCMQTLLEMVAIVVFILPAIDQSDCSIRESVDSL